ncbi:MAG: serpin family protein [Solirubrobacteraceae bacterium]
MSRVMRASIVVALCAASAGVWSGGSSAAGRAASGGAVGAHTASSHAATAETKFALALLPLLGGSGNVVYSPYSIDTALTMADAGAAGNTATQIDRVLHEGTQSEAVSDASAIRSALAAAITAGPGAPKLDVANALWTQSGLALQSPFVATLTNDFGAPPQSTDFAGAPAAALQAINQWVSSNTGGLIRQLLAPGQITPATAFVLANAIYLKAHWQSPFDASLTHPGPFTTASGQSVQVPFMKQEDTSYDYGSGPAYQAIDLPYLSSSLSLLAIMPRARSLRQFDRTLSAASLTKIEGSLSQHSVDLQMPKLDLSTQLSLNAPLKRLGMTDAFGPAANFSALTTQQALNISLVEHAADLKIDEQGTVAAAATAIVGPTAIARPPGPIIKLTLDHPYLLLLRDDASGTILFVAQVANPSER